MKKEDLKLLQQEVSLLRVNGKYKETIEAGYRLLKCGMELNDHKSILIAHIHNAASYYCIGDIEEAFNSIDAYQDICQNHGDEEDRLNLYNTQFLLYEFNKDYAKAKETLEKSIELGKKIKKYNIVSNGYSNYSHVCLAEENYHSALEMAKMGLEMAKLHKPSYPALEFRVKLNMAQSYIEMRDFEASRVLIDEMINDPLLESFIREKSQCYMLQGSWFFKQKLYLEAFQSLTSAKELVESYKDVYLLKTIQEERCKLCELMDDIENGYIVQKEYISLLKEISDQELALTALKLDVKHSLTAFEKKANTDFLTGLYNRNYLETTTNEWLKQASLKNETIICIVFDIDNFKSINDEYGHLFGDEAIKMIGHACSTIIGDNELIGRYGGDEFVVVLKGISLESGIKKAEQIEATIRNYKINKDGQSVTITTSIGVANNLNGTVVSFNDLFHIADIGLYKAKQNGRNQIYIEN